MNSNMWAYEKILKDMMFEVFSAGYEAGLSQTQTFADSFNAYYRCLCQTANMGLPTASFYSLDAKDLRSVESEEALMHVYLAGYRAGSPGKPPLAEAFKTWYQKEVERNA